MIYRVQSMSSGIWKHLSGDNGSFSGTRLTFDNEWKMWKKYFFPWNSVQVVWNILGLMKLVHDPYSYSYIVLAEFEIFFAAS